MSVEEILRARSNGHCELCGADTDLASYAVPPKDGSDADGAILACSTCRNQIENPDQVDANHWRCLNDSMWSQVPAVQVMAWRMLKQLSSEGWPQDLLDMLYLDEETLAWAKAGQSASSGDESAKTLDCHGAVLQAGDTVTLVKDLDVKGAGFTAKRGTAVRNISLTGNPEQIEGRVNGVRIVLLTKYLKKSS
ncbi:MAG: PhnA domain-containing protein [Porticoccaceae bacterium]